MDQKTGSTPLAEIRDQIDRDRAERRRYEAMVNIFADPTVKNLLQSIRSHANGMDVSHYLREEIIYVQSGYRVADRHTYLDSQAEPRLGRSIRLDGKRRGIVFRVLARWEEWLRSGNLCDVDGVTRQAAEHFVSEESLAEIRRRFRTDFVLVDEAQDLSTLELRLLGRLVADPDAENAVFLVGDLNQKAFPKHQRAKSAGFNFQGRVDAIRQNYRNTRQILRAACVLPERYPPPPEEYVPVTRPELSDYEGSRPLVVECTHVGQADKVAAMARQVLGRGKGQRVAIVSANERLLAKVKDLAAREGIRCFELYTVEDIDLWSVQKGDPLSAKLVVSKTEAVKGFEFDTVILCDLSAVMVPRPGMPAREYWREAAVVYSAMTRARDELVLTYAGTPSEFLEAIVDEIESIPVGDEVSLAEVLAKIA